MLKLSQKIQKYLPVQQRRNSIPDTELKAGVIIMDYIKTKVYAGRIKRFFRKLHAAPLTLARRNIVAGPILLF